VNYLWAFGDGNTDTLPAPSHTYQNAGTYTIQLIVSSQCDVDTFSRQIIVLDTNTVKSSADLISGLPTVYPNPGNEEISLSNLPGENCTEISIFNLQGKKVLSLPKSEEINFLTISVAGLTPGLYFIHAGNVILSWRKIE
jgi:hypothetical protein